MIIIKIYYGSDHRATAIKEQIIEYIKSLGYEVVSSSLPNYPTDDYPDFAYDVASLVVKNNALGVLVCGSGIGVSIAANKVNGVKCARVTNTHDAFLARNEDGANIIALSADIPILEIKDIIKTFLETEISFEERHQRRIGKVSQIEQGTYEL